MPGVCVGAVGEDTRIRPLAGEVSVPETDIHVLGYHPLAYQMRVHKNCPHNQYAALAKRHIIDRTYINFQPKVWAKSATSALAELRSRMPRRTVVRYPYSALPKYYTGGKRLIYERAVEYLNHHSIQKKHANIRMFVKPDKHPLCKVMDKVPRAIQYRDPVFNTMLMSYLRPIEHDLYSTLNEDGTRSFAKGRSPQQRAQDILDIYGQYKTCLMIAADHSKFDSCVRVEHLRRIHRFYKKFHDGCPVLNWLLEQQINNKGMSRFWRYKVRGTRMSGDFDTALGNSLINYVVLKGWLASHGVSGHVYIDGDDSVVFIEAGDLAKLRFDCEAWGFETTFSVHEDLYDVEFCQTRLIRSDPPNMVRDPRKVLASLAICLNKYAPTTWPAILQGKIKCEIYANQGAPYICEYLSSMLKSQVGFVMPQDSLFKWASVKNHVLGRCTDQALVDYHLGWGLPFDFSSSLLHLNTYCQFRKLTGSTVRSTKRPNKRPQYVLESVQQAWGGYLTMDGSPDLCCGPSCKCGGAFSTCTPSVRPTTRH